MADFTGQNIQDTYQRVVQVDKGQLQDGTGSALPIAFDGNDVIVPGAIRANSYIVSESLITVSSGSTIFGNSFDDIHVFSGSVDIRDKVNTDYNTVTPSLSVRQDAVDRSQIANGFGGSIDFFTQRGSNSSGARTGRISNFIFSNAQSVSDKHAFKFTIRNDDTQVDALTIAPSSTSDAQALIGIMDTTPSFTLDVNGSFRSTGVTRFDNNITASGNFNQVRSVGDISSKTNISASANLIGQNLSVSTGRITGDTGKPTQLLVNGFISATNITASGDISASGTGKFSDGIFLGNVGIGTNNPSEELEIFKTGANAEMAITRGTDTQIKLKAQDTKTRITYEGGPLLFDRDESGTNTLALGIGGHITASGNISSSGQIIATSFDARNTSEGFLLQGAKILYTDGDGHHHIGNHNVPLALTGSSIEIGHAGDTGLHVTASGDISASGTITADKFNTRGAVYRIQGTKAIYTDSGTVFGRSPNITKISGSNIILKAHVTASGNISASGDILANQISVIDPAIFTVDGNGITHVNNLSVGNSLQNDTHTLIGKTEVRGNLTASNEISASGDIYGQTIYGHQFEQFSSNFTFNFNGTLTDTVFMPISDQSVSEHASSATNVNVNRTSVVAGRPVKTVIRSTGNDNLRSVAITCSVFYNHPGLGSAGAGPGDTNTGQLHLVSAGTMGPDSNHAAIEIDYSNPISGSYGDIPAGSRFYMTMDAKGAYSDSGDSITDLENTSFIVTNLWRWDYTQL